MKFVYRVIGVLSFLSYGIALIFVLISKIDSATRFIYLLFIVFGLLASSIYFTVPYLMEEIESLKYKISGLQVRVSNYGPIKKPNSSFIKPKKIGEITKCCPMCNEEVTDNATSCDSCGYKF